MELSCLSLNTITDSIYTVNYEVDKHYEHITNQIYWKKKYPPEIENFLIKKSDILIHWSREPAVTAGV